MKIIDLLNKIANGEEVPKKIKYDGIEYEEEPCYMLYEVAGECSESQLKNLLNDQVEIIEEEKELHGNNIEFNIYDGKRDCVITLDENDLGIDKLHIDNCYFYKKDNEWYVNKLNFQTIDIKKDKEIEKIELDGKYIVTYTTGIRQLINTNKKDRDIYIKKINELIDKVNSLEKKQ